MKKSLFRYRLCKWKSDLQVYLLTLFDLTNKNKDRIKKLEQKITFIESRITHIEELLNRNRCSKNSMFDFLDNQYIGFILKVIITVISFIFILHWTEEKGMRQDLLDLLKAVL